MTDEGRLAEVMAALEEVGLVALVMGGHAVRFYGLHRHTNDIDLHLSPGRWDDLSAAIGRTSLAKAFLVVEGPSWRRGWFCRFQIGFLPDGSEEWLEFWRGNHLLDPFDDLYSRRREGEYGGRRLAFLSIADLIRSKETERTKDWQDIEVLEEFGDAALRARFLAGELDAASYLANLRSRRGFETLLRPGEMPPVEEIDSALGVTRNPITQSLLLPLSPASRCRETVPTPLEPMIEARLRKERPGSSLHLSLVTLVRKRYQDARMALDRADKQAILAQLNPP